ncbi:hypothetical protein L207DRAFT_523582 [Hyaloscypha variabilis F]|uniref:Zn(2)-C6 fungal-type domain-containing protein n=1 Tax=Hyaloscypha variabilis (strain UAMH 11265 / GT02V1 / F) TaxID=1149755 RepID=A0A2J6S5X4_HYAVF|nr:hypothetical protein L207DRAFT_523582 [Hyaloscypha variabilis F]
MAESPSPRFGKFMGRPKKRTKRHRLQHTEWKDEGETTAVQKQSADTTILGGYSSTIGQYLPSPDILPKFGSGSEHRAKTTALVSKSSSSAAHDGDRGAKRASKSSACDQCYRFKVKCVRNGDSCQRCAGNSSICTFSFSSASEEDNDIGPPTSRYAAKRHRFSGIQQQLSIQTPTQDQPSNGSIQENEWAGTNGDLPQIHADKESILEPNQGRLGGPGYDNRGAGHSNMGEVLSISIGTSEDMYDFSSETVNLDSVIPAWSPLTLDVSTLGLSYSNNQSPGLEIFSNAGQQTKDSCESSQSQSQELSHHSQCSCLVSALSTLSNLHELGQPMTCTKTTLDLNRTLSTTRDSLLICEKISDCRSCSRYTMLMFCVTILQQIAICYEILCFSISGNHLSPPLSIKIGDMEFSEVAYAPGIMQAVLSGECKKASGVCERFLDVCEREGDLRGNAYKAGTAIRELLDLLKRGFAR